MKLRRRARRGLTLVEVILALLLMTFAFLVFGTSFPAASQMQLRGRHTDVAVDACQQQLEYYRNVGYYSLPLVAGQSKTTVSFTPPSSLPGATGAVTFTRVDASLAETSQETRRVRADARITWQGRHLDRGTTALTTLITR